VVKSSAPAVIDRIRYSSWGDATYDVDSGNGYKNFTGKSYDFSGFIYFNARYYDPYIGRFITEDPSQKGEGWYTYCGNNPIIMVDLDGRKRRDSAAGDTAYGSTSWDKTVKEIERTKKRIVRRVINILKRLNRKNDIELDRTNESVMSLLSYFYRNENEIQSNQSEDFSDFPIDYSLSSSESFYGVPWGPLGSGPYYSQSTGVFIGPNGERYEGFSGRDVLTLSPLSGTPMTIFGKNNPAYQDYVDIGSIPQGAWRVGPIIENSNLGKISRWLEPLYGNRVFESERVWNSFYMHLGNVSKGCIIMTSEEAICSIPSGTIFTVTE